MWIRIPAQKEVLRQDKTLESGAVAEHFMEELGQLQFEGKKEFKQVKRMKKNNPKI